MYILNQSPHNVVFRHDGRSVLVRGTAGFFGSAYIADSGVAYTEATPEAVEICQADPNWLSSHCSVTSRLPDGITPFKTEVTDHREPQKAKAEK